MSDLPPQPPNVRKPAFHRQPVAMLVLLTVVTMGLYPLWLLYQHSRVINAHERGVRVPAWLPPLAIVSTLAFIAAFVKTGTDLATPRPLEVQVLNAVATASTLLWVLLVRRGINDLSEAQPGAGNWISLGLTLLLSVLFGLAPLYFQHVVNRELAARGRE